MSSELFFYFRDRTPPELIRDVVDVFLVYYIIYRTLLVLKGTRATQVGIGLGLFFLLYVVAQKFQLATMYSILGALMPEGAILIMVVVFQNDIRRALMRMGSQPWFGIAKVRESRAIDEVVEAATELARHRTGAIIAFEQDANLDEFVGANKGHSLDAAVTRELLVSIFIPEAMNKLHDGAVIIRNLRIAKAGAFFPMPDTRVLDPSFGSRHRAALGITEETDAVVVVVSEERGSISFCFNGNIVGNLDGPGLRRALEGVFSPKPRKKRKVRPRVEPVVPPAAEIRLSTPGKATEAEATPPPLTPEPTPATRIRTTEPGEPAGESEPPAPLRKAKPEKTDEPPVAAAKGSAAPLTTPMRSNIKTAPEPRPMPTSADKTPRPSTEESVPDSTEKGDST